MDKFINWYRNYYAEITWFIIGVLFVNLLQALASGAYAGACLDAVLMYINYYFWKHNV
jgi:hypothetical protein